MKYFSLVSISMIALALVGCETFRKPLKSESFTNPLDAPGQSDPVVIKPNTYTPKFTAGSFLQTVSSQTALFSSFPSANEQPSKILRHSTDVKVISNKGSYVKIEVLDTGVVGYVPAVMLGKKKSRAEVAASSNLPLGVSPGVAPDLTLPDVTLSPDIPYSFPDPEIPGLGPAEIVDPTKPAE